MRNCPTSAPILLRFIGLGGICLLGICASALGEEEEDGWKVRNYRGMPYLSLESIQESYGFEKVVVEDTEFELRAQGALIRGKMNRKLLDINGLAYHLHYGPIRLEGKLYLAAFDVTNVLDLILRPTGHMRPKALHTVYVEAVEDQWSTKPDAKDVSLEIQHALAGYGVTVRFLGTNSGGIVGDSMEIDGEGGTVWIRLQGNGKLSHHEFRTSVLAPPGAPERGEVVHSAEEMAAVYVGNLYDAQSLALATLIQTGLVFGPGAKASDAVDAGIRQIPSEAFQRASGAAVHIEWGEEIDPIHLLKSVIAGILRYSSFLEGQVKAAKALEEKNENTLEIQGVVLELVDHETLRMRVALGKVDSGKSPDQEKIDVQAFVFAREGTSAIQLISAPPPKVTWISNLPAWEGDQPEELNLSYHLGASAAEVHRETFGHIVRLIYDGQVQDVQAHPQGLLNQLWRYSAIFPN